MMKKMLPFLPVFLLIAGCSAGTGIPAVKELDISKYAGRWYEIARLPNRFEKNMTGVSAEYTLEKTGLLRVVNRGTVKGKRRSVSGVARPAGEPGTGELEVSFFRPFYGAYRVIKLAPDYRYSVVMGSSKKRLWILARQRTLSPADRQEIGDFLKQHGFSLQQLLFTQGAGESGSSSDRFRQETR